MGRQWSREAPWDLVAMSDFDTITALAESPKVEGLLYAGTDDGLIQVSEDGGAHWRRIEVGTLPGVPAGAFVNDLKADLHDADTVYAALDHHKAGDFTPFLLKSEDRGRTWRSIAGDLPARHLVWRVVQDHVRPELLFAGTEFGVFFTVDGGRRWIELTGGTPTIPFRDLAIQRRENDLVGATFGRGLWVLDDYSPLREVSEEALAREAAVFPVRKAWWYVQRRPLADSGPGDLGHAHYVAPNPPFGAVFTYHLSEGLVSREKRRQEREKPLAAAGRDTPYPEFEELEAERREAEPAILLVVRDRDGKVVRRLTGPAGKGIHRVAWDLRHAPTEAITEPERTPSPWGELPTGSLAAPGTYTVTFARRVDGAVTELAPPVPFEVVRLREGALSGADPAAVAAFTRRLDEARRLESAADAALEAANRRVALLAAALADSSGGTDLDAELESIRQELLDVERLLRGDRVRAEAGQPQPPTPGQRLGAARLGTSQSTYGPTPTHARSLEIAEQELAQARTRLARVVGERLPALERRLEAAGAPWTPGRPVP
jgi:hypothetical protein